MASEPATAKDAPWWAYVLLAIGVCGFCKLCHYVGKLDERRSQAAAASRNDRALQQEVARLRSRIQGASRERDIYAEKLQRLAKQHAELERRLAPYENPEGNLLIEPVIPRGK